MKRKIICILLLSLILIFSSIPQKVNAASLSWSDIENSAKGFLEEGENQYDLDETQLQNIVIPISQILVVVGNIVVVIAMAVMAIKYIVSSPEDKAKLKTQLVGVIVAAVVIFGAQFIWSTMYNLFQSF